MSLRQDAEFIVTEAIKRVLPDEAVRQALEGKDFGGGRVYLAAAGKAAWQMAKTATEILGDDLKAGVCVTKYDHVKGNIKKVDCYEGGHPVPDENAFRGTEAVLRMAGSLKPEDTVIFLLSGGGSALFEKPLISGESWRTLPDSFWPAERILWR